MSHEEVRSSPAGSGGHLLWGDHVVVLGPDRTMSEGYLTAEARAPGSRSTASSHLAGGGAGPRRLRVSVSKGWLPWMRSTPWLAVSHKCLNHLADVLHSIETGGIEQ